MNFASHCSAANIYQQTIKKKKKYSRTGETSFRIFNFKEKSMLFFCLGEAYNNIHFACCQRNDIPNVAFPVSRLDF